MLSARNIMHRYGARAVLDIAQLDLEPGTITAIVGPNGSGKSTLLRLLAFVERPTGGTIALDGRPVVAAADRHAARRRVTLVEQKPLLFRGSVIHNLEYALSLHGVNRADRHARVIDALERAGVPQLGPRQARSLSEGEVQRVAIARALALGPDVMLLDEPTSAADRSAVSHLYQALQKERERGTTLCFASHQLEAAYRWSERLVALTEGKADSIIPENLFRATLPEGSGQRVVRIGPLDVQLVTDRVGPVTIALPPEDITVSREPYASSVRNQFRGTVVRIADAGPGWVTVGVDAGVDVAARITPGALDELGLTIGTEVVLSIKALAVRVY